MAEKLQKGELPGKEPIQTREGSRDEDILREARDRAQRASGWWRHNFNAAKEDIAFLAGNQWPDNITLERTEEQRPVLTLNTLPQYVDQVVGDQRQNRPAISVHPVEADKRKGAEGKLKNVAGSQDYSLAEVYQGLIRNIEYISNAEAHYDTAFQHAVEGGFGWLRVLTQYSTEDSFELDLVIRSIHNRFSVLMDPDAIEPDFSDANWCLVSQWMKKSEFKKRYPNKRRGDLTDADRGDLSWWVTDEDIKVSEYFYREPETRTLYLLSDGRVVWHEDVEPVLDELAEMGVTITRTRKVKTYRVKWEKITAYDRLEGPVDWPGSTIPVIPVFGKEITMGDKVYYRGLIRYAKDAQKMHNYWMTSATERVALAPKAPYVAEDEAIEGYEYEWQNANRKNFSVLRYKTGYQKPQREQPATMPAAELQLALSATDELKETIGIYDPSLGAESNETSGKAILARQRQGDRGTFAYIDNLSRAIRRVGKVLIELIPQIYDSERVLRLRFEDDSGDWVKINQTVKDDETGKDVLVHDIAAGKFDVTVKAGPSYQTQRLEAADTMMEFVQAVPQSGQVVLDLIAKNMDWPGSQEIAKRLKKTLPPGMLDPDEMKEEGIEPPQLTPEQQTEVAKAEADKAKAEAELQKLQIESEAAKIQAEADKATAQANIAEAQAKMAEIEQNAQAAGQDSIEETVRNLVAEAMAEFMAQSNQQQ